MDSLCNDKAQKESTKFEHLNNKIEQTRSLIADLSDNVINLENKLGEMRDTEPCDATKNIERTSIIERATLIVEKNNDDIKELTNRLQLIVNLF